MAVIYAVGIKTSRMTATRDSVAGGVLQILTSADAVIATFTLSVAGGTVSGDTWTLAFVASTVSASGGGTAAKARILNSSESTLVTGITVGTTGSDINLDNVVITSGQNVQLTSAQIQHAA